MRILKWLYRKYPEVLLLLLASLVFLSNLDVLVVNIMEARNFITAREMLTHGNWIFTTMNELPRYEKPPLPTWLTAVSAGIFGIDNLFAYRLPAAIAAIFLIIIFYKLQLRLQIQKSVAFWGSIILMTSFYIVFSGRDGQWDIFTHSFMMGCCYFFVLMLQFSANNFKNAVIAGLFFGASLMSKGPVSLYALFLPFLIGFGFTYRFSGIGKKWKLLLVFIVTGLIFGSWWTLIVHYFDAAAFTEIAEQESSRWFNYNVRPFYYYWSFFTQSGIWTVPALLGLFWWYLKRKVSNLKAYQFYLIWTFVSLLLLSIIPEKKSRYLLPVLIPLAMTTAFYVEYVIRNFRRNFSKTEKIPIYLNFGLLTIICFAGPAVFYYALGNTVWQKAFVYIAFSIGLFLFGTFFIYGLKQSKIKLLFALQAGLIFLILVVGFPLAGLIDPSQKNFDVANLKKKLSQENLRLYDATSSLPELIWEFGKPIPVITTGEERNFQAEKFGVLIGPGDPDWEDNLRGYDLQLINTVDLNPTISPGKNLRLIRKFYIATKQQ